MTFIMQERGYMLEIKIAGEGNLIEEYNLLTKTPNEENGFSNEFNVINYYDYQHRVLKELNERRAGINLKVGYVPDTLYILWLDDEAIGMFSFRHYLNDFLSAGPGHIGFSILKEYRNQGYGSRGLGLLLEIVKDQIKEDEIYMSCNKDNQASLKMQLNNHAYIHHEDDKHYYTRIKLNEIGVSHEN